MINTANKTIAPSPLLQKDAKMIPERLLLRFKEFSLLEY